MWCIPPKHSAEFVYHMEDVLEVYRRPHDPKHPVVCLDETFTQLIGETREPLAPAPGRVERYDCVYVRNGTASLFLAFEPLAGWRHVAVTEGRKRGDWARFVAALLEGRYAEVEKLVLVMDQLNTHSPASLYEIFPPERAKRLADRLVVEHGRDRVQRARPPPAGAGRRQVSAGAPRDGVGAGPERRRGRGRLALHHGRRPDQAPQALPDDQCLTEY